MNKLPALRYFPILLLAAVDAQAMSDNLQFQGFASQGIIYAPDNAYFDEDTGLNFNYRELGLNASWSASDRVRLAGQLLSRRAGDLDDGDPKIDFLLVDFNFYATEDVSAGVRLGRVKSPYGLYNKTRDIPHGRPGVLAPQSVYFESMRSALISLDGGNLYSSVATPVADITFDVFGGTAHFDNQAVEYDLFQKAMPGEFRDIDGGGLHLLANPKILPELTLGYTFAGFSTEYEDAPTFSQEEILDALDTLGDDVSLYPQYITNFEMEASIHVLSAQYSTGDWIFTAERAVINLRFDDVEVLHYPVPRELIRDKYTSTGFYLQAEWQAREKLSVYGRYEELYMNEDDKDGTDYAETGFGNALTQYNTALTLGARWYFTPDFSATAEYSKNKGAAFLNGQSDIDYSALKKHWDLLLLQFSYHF